MNTVLFKAIIYLIKEENVVVVIFTNFISRKEFPNFGLFDSSWMHSPTVAIGWYPLQQERIISVKKEEDERV